MCKKKDEVFLTAQAEMVETERRCEAKLDRYRAEAKRFQVETDRIVRDKDSHLRWLKEGMSADRTEMRWLREELRSSKETRNSAVQEALTLQECLGGENERLKAAFSWAQRCYTGELEKSVLLRAKLERAEATICGLQQSQGKEITGFQEERSDSSMEEAEPYPD